MTPNKLLVRSIFYYWRTNLAVLLGVIAGTAVIGGALIVGDSVRDSLKQMTLDRLGQIDFVLAGHRFFREDLANEISEQSKFAKRFTSIAPALVMQGGFVHEKSLETESAKQQRITRAGKVNIYGVDERLWNLTSHGTVDPPIDDEVIFNSKTGAELGVKPGDEVTLYVELPLSIPRESLLGKREVSSEAITLTVKAVLGEEIGLGRLALNPSQQLPSNAFLSLRTLQKSLDLNAERRSRQNPQGQPARVNTLFVSAIKQSDKITITAETAAEELTSNLSSALQLEDLQLRIVENEKQEYLSLESERMILETSVADAAKKAATELKQQSQPVLVYLANQISSNKEPGLFSRYSIIAGIDDFSRTDSPFGPWKFQGETPAKLTESNIIINEWLAEDLDANVGDKADITWHTVGSHGELPEKTRQFTIRGIVPMANTIANDRGLTPEVKGITDVEGFADWDAPFPMKAVTGRDDDYWTEYRATPKGFVTLKTAQELWRSRYGELTTFRVSAVPGKSLSESRDLFESAFLKSLDPADMYLSFQPVKYFGIRAASGTTDFTGLFIGFSFFLILSATILIGLLFRLGIERRGTDIGLLSAIGLTPNAVRRLFLGEGMIVVVAGGLLGLAVAVGYASLMVHGLKTWWYGAIGTQFLFVSVQPVSLIVGLLISVLVAFGAVWYAIRGLRSISTRDLLSGVTQQALSAEAQQHRGKRAKKIGQCSISISVVLMILAFLGAVPTTEAFSGISWQMVAFFISGTSALVASLTFLSAWLDSDHSVAVHGAGATGLGRLSIRNAARHRQRSVLSVALIASASFVIVAVAAGHRNPAVETPDINSGNGGFMLVAETSKGILHDLNTTEGRNKLDLSINADAATLELFDKMIVMPFRVNPGENASCLNIYQTRLPTILGVPQQMIERGGFKFINAKEQNPWELLTRETAEGEIPVLGDMNSLMYSLHKAVGDTIEVTDNKPPGSDEDYQLRISGMFDGSIFQGVLLMSEENFKKLYPERAGYEYFLIGDKRFQKNPHTLTKDQTQQLSDLLESKLTDYGFDAERVVDRLANFLSVQNTYLSTFQTLGGLGLLLGTLGLTTVMLRNVLERRQELALLRAVGFQNINIALLVLFENAFLLLWGLASGTLAALLAMMPHILTIGADVPWSSGGLILGSVFIVGMLAAFLAVVAAVRTPILASLRSE